MWVWLGGPSVGAWLISAISNAIHRRASPPMQSYGRRHHLPKTIQPFYEPEEIERVLRVIGKYSIYALRDRAIVLTLFGCGVRASELCGMRIEDLNLPAGQGTLFSEGCGEGWQRAVAYTLLGKDKEAQQDVDRAVALGFDRGMLDEATEEFKKERQAEAGNN